MPLHFGRRGFNRRSCSHRSLRSRSLRLCGCRQHTCDHPARRSTPHLPRNAPHPLPGPLRAPGHTHRGLLRAPLRLLQRAHPTPSLCRRPRAIPRLGRRLSFPHARRGLHPPRGRSSWAPSACALPARLWALSKCACGRQPTLRFHRQIPRRRLSALCRLLHALCAPQDGPRMRGARPHGGLSDVRIPFPRQ